MTSTTINSHTPVGYPKGCRADDCDWYYRKCCTHPKERKRNDGVCDGYKQDCFNWEFCR